MMRIGEFLYKSFYELARRGLNDFGWVCRWVEGVWSMVAVSHQMVARDISS